jgi:hypothetical protein
MRIDSSGNVGIGVTSPTGVLHVVGRSKFQASGNDTAITLINQSGGDANLQVLGTSTSSIYRFNTYSTGDALRIENDGNVQVGASSVANCLIGNDGDLINIKAKKDGTDAIPLTFMTQASGGALSERMRIDGSGNVGIGVTSPAQKLSVHGNVNFNTTSGDGNEARHLFGVGGAADAGSYTIYQDDGSTAGVLIHAGQSSYFVNNLGVGDTSPAYRLELPNTASSAGQVRANAYITYSDSRIKSNIQTLSYGLDIVKQLKPSQYKHHNSIKEDGQFVKQDEGANDIGFIAQEVLPLIPEVVSVPVDTDKDLYSISYPKLTAVLTKAIQEQQTLIETQQTTINDLKSRVETLEG